MKRKIGSTSHPKEIFVTLKSYNECLIQERFYGGSRGGSCPRAAIEGAYNKKDRERGRK